jgi:hypothetical protein
VIPTKVALVPTTVGVTATQVATPPTVVATVATEAVAAPTSVARAPTAVVKTAGIVRRVPRRSEPSPAALHAGGLVRQLSKIAQSPCPIPGQSAFKTLRFRNSTTEAIYVKTGRCYPPSC